MIMCHPAITNQQQAELKTILETLESDTQTVFQPHQLRNGYLFYQHNRPIGCVLFSPVTVPEWWYYEPSDTVYINALVLLRPVNLGVVFRSFYRVCDWNRLHFPLRMLVNPATSQGLEMDTRLGFRPYFPPFYVAYFASREHMPLFDRRKIDARFERDKSATNQNQA